MGEICVRSDFMLSLLGEVGKTRALAPHETDVIEDCIAQELMPFRWNPRLDNALLVASHSPGGIARFCRRIGITRGMADARLLRIRRKQKWKKDRISVTCKINFTDDWKALRKKRKAARKGREA